MRVLFKHHNAIDINGDVPIIFTPFYHWLWLQHDGGYTYDGLIPSLNHYMKFSLKLHKLTDYHIMCYRHIMDTFQREVTIHAL